MSRSVIFHDFKIYLDENKEFDKLTYTFDAEEDFFGDTITQSGEMIVLLDDIGTTDVRLPNEEVRNVDLKNKIEAVLALDNYSYDTVGTYDAHPYQYLFEKDQTKTREYVSKFAYYQIAEAERFTYQDSDTGTYYGVFKNNAGEWYSQIQTEQAIQSIYALNYIDYDLFYLQDDGSYQPSELTFFFAAATYCGVINKYYASAGGMDVVEYSKFIINIENGEFSSIEYRYDMVEHIYYSSTNSFEYYEYYEDCIATLTKVGTTSVSIPTVTAI